MSDGFVSVGSIEPIDWSDDDLPELDEGNEVGMVRPATEENTIDTRAMAEDMVNVSPGNESLTQIRDLTERAEALTKQLEERDVADDDMHMKWRVADDGLYTSVGHTTREIPPGVYDIVVDARGTVYWQEIEPRTEDIIRFKDAPIDEVVSEIERFWSREAMFRLYGLPFKRGILLHGPPGSGKSCTLQLVAREMVKRGGYVVQFNSVEHFVSGYRILRSVQPKAPLVVLMEDLEEILKGKTSSGESRILNLLDGIESTDNVVFLATTNYPQYLGDRIANRPSRFDHRVYVAHPDENARREYLESIIDKNDTQEIDIEKYVKDTDGLSLAHAKELFVAAHILGEDYVECAMRLKRMKAKPTSVDDGDEFVVPRGAYA
jgi:ATP-dependent 26S proteasome regulatory subunit